VAPNYTEWRRHRHRRRWGSTARPCESEGDADDEDAAQRELVHAILECVAEMRSRNRGSWDVCVSVELGEQRKGVSSSWQHSISIQQRVHASAP
jgi:hypothetical protein